jgi:hypothetical protein
MARVHVFPEYHKAHQLANALFTLKEYYRQARRGDCGELEAIADMLDAAVPPGRQVTDLYPFNPAELAAETPEKAASRRGYWHGVLRPLITTRGLLELLAEADVTERHISHPTTYTRAMRDRALEVLREAVAYWDGVYLLHSETSTC